MLPKVNKVPRGFEIDNFPAIADLDAIEDVIQQEISQDAVANAAILTGTGVTAGKLWIVTSICAYNNDGTAVSIYLIKTIGTTSYAITRKETLARRESVDFHGIIVLNSGEKLAGVFGGTEGATDNCRFYYCGYQIDKH